MPEPLPDRLQKMADGIRTLLSTLTPEERQQVLRELSGAAPIPTPRAGKVLSLVTRSLPRDKAFTVAEVKERVAGTDARVTEKEVYNAIGYLKRHRYLKRLGYGHYTFTDGEGRTVVVSETGEVSDLEPPNCCGD